jgi:methylglutaconyl-CoA hydratase
MDLAELRETISASVDANIIWDDAHRLAALYHRLYTLPKPTIALVNGAAVAGGAGLVTVCDLAVAVESAVFGYPEVRRGLVAAMVMPHLLRHVGERTARHLLLTGELIAAPEAVRCDLINECVSADRLSARGRELAASLAEGGPQALATTKALLQRVAPSALSLEEAARGSAEPRLTDECREGLTAFFEKRTVSWSPGVTSS